MLWIPFWAAGVINGLGHYWGYRNYEPRDASTNIAPWGILVGGEELHNNHHAFPTSARLSNKWWEFDLGWCYIQVLQALGLAKVRRLAPRPQRVPGKQVVDLDTLRAVLLNRFYIMADFGRQVVLPALKEELQKADVSRRSFLKRARIALLREDARLKPQERLRLQNVLGSSQTLRTIYDYRMQLQAVWNRHTVNSEKVLAALQDWCAQAEASGIRSLHDFAQVLRSYSLRAV
jgi:stearoyl-CoA desaturase (delta-9 desaturase)